LPGDLEVRTKSPHYLRVKDYLRRRRFTLSRFIAALLGACSFAACAGQSPLDPTASSSTPSLPADGLSARAPAGAPGVYALSFHARVNGTYQEVSSLTVSSGELILGAQVTDTSGAPAQQGTVTFEYCSYKKLPPNDITRADEAPTSACAQGVATWKRLISIPIGANGCSLVGPGSVCMSFGLVRIPRTVGFRFRYAPQTGVIAAGTSEPKDFVWVAAS
jgi:hypothetical protein